MSTPQKALEIVQNELSQNGNLHQLATSWDINYGHLWRLVNRGTLSPTLLDRMIELGFFDPEPTRYRICYEAGYGEAGARRKEEIYRWLEQHNWESFTAFIDDIVAGEEAYADLINDRGL